MVYICNLLSELEFALFFALANVNAYDTYGMKLLTSTDQVDRCYF